jgi:putative transposase
MDAKRALVETGVEGPSVTRQCELLGFARSSLYHKPCGESAENLALMRLIDAQYLKTPMYGVPRMTAQLRRDGWTVNPKRVRRLMRLMNLEAVYAKPRLSARNPEHHVFPYLLRDLKIDRPNQVWATDITYIPLANGFVYLMAILDWFSRYVVTWELSTSLDAAFCVRALERALGQTQPEIMNSDQGSQFTSQAWTKVLEGAGVQISMDGRGRFYDNIFIERLWRSVKYEDVYLRDYESVLDARTSLGRYFRFYNELRLHQALGYRPPQEIYVEAA